MSFIMSRSGGLKQNHNASTTNQEVVNQAPQQIKSGLQTISVTELLKLSPQEIRNSLNAQHSSSVSKPTHEPPQAMVNSGANIMNKPHGINSSTPVYDMY